MVSSSVSGLVQGFKVGSSQVGPQDPKFESHLVCQANLLQKMCEINIPRISTQSKKLSDNDFAHFDNGTKFKTLFEIKPPFKATKLGIFEDQAGRCVEAFGPKLDLIRALESGRIVSRDLGGSDPERMAPPRYFYCYFCIKIYGLYRERTWQPQFCIQLVYKQHLTT